MFEIIKNDTNFNFVSKFNFSAGFSLVLVAIAMFFATTRMNYGVDFRGGAEVQIKFREAVSLSELRGALGAQKGGAISFRGATVQSIGETTRHEYLIRMQAEDDQLNETAEALEKMLLAKFTNERPEIRKIDIVGPKAGASLRISGLQAMLFALIAIMVYIGLRFEFKYSPGAIGALFHDVVIVLGVFAISGMEFTLQTVAALLAVIGYSVNDTVIVYDRVREQEANFPSQGLDKSINRAINETLSRTILTSGTTLFISLAMLFFGGSALQDFFLAISLGVLIGTYSSIFVAAPVTLIFHRRQEKQVKKS